MAVMVRAWWDGGAIAPKESVRKCGTYGTGGLGNRARPVPLQWTGA